MQLEEKIYNFLCVLFVTITVISNLLYQKFIHLPIFSIYTFELSVGAIFYPLTFLITNIITEFYGKKRARFCVRMAIIINLLALGLVSYMASLKATSWSKIDDQTFYFIFQSHGVSVISSIIAGYIAQITDINLYLFIRKITNNEYLILRNFSSVISLFIDTSLVVIFITVIGRTIPYYHLFPLILDSYSFKLFFIIVTTPIFYGIVKGVKLAMIKREQLLTNDNF